MERKDKILEILRESQGPVKGTDLGEEFQVSRQVIVQDIAILRAEGENIVATNRGYLIPTDKLSLRKTIVCQHSSLEEIKDELEIVVDNGGRVKDVIVDHPVYGEIRTPLEIRSRKDIKSFISELVGKEGEPLSSLTDGVHMHTIEIDNLEDFREIERGLLEKKYLIKE